MGGHSLFVATIDPGTCALPHEHWQPNPVLHSIIMLVDYERNLYFVVIVFNPHTIKTGQAGAEVSGCEWRIVWGQNL